MFLIKFNKNNKFIRIFLGYEESNQEDALKFDTYEDAFYEIAKVHMDETVPYHFQLLHVFYSPSD